MKVIIAGGRDISVPSELIQIAVKQSGFDVTEVISGGASGVDRCGEIWANKYGIPIVIFPARWTIHGKSAGPIRNKEMAEYSDALIAFPGGEGTSNMILQMRNLNKPIYLYKGPI